MRAEPTPPISATPISAVPRNSAPTGSAPPPPPRPLRFRFSLRTLLVAMLLSGLVCGWVGRRAFRARREQEAITRFVSQERDNFGFYWSADEHGDRSEVQGAGPDWLRDLLPKRFFTPVRKVVLFDASDEALAELKAFGDLRCLELIGGQITDRGVEHIARLMQLRYLSLEDSAVTDESLFRLRGLTNLNVLNFTGPSVSNVGLKFVRDMRHLERLSIGKNSQRLTLRDDGLSHLRHLTQLKSLEFDLGEISDAGMADLGRLTGLERLEISNDHVTDAGMRHLGALHNLKILDLRCPQVAGAGLAELKNCRQLGYLKLSNMPVTATVLRPLGSLPSLSSLVWRDNAHSAAGFEPIAGLRKLASLELAGANIDDETLAYVAQLPQLQFLALERAAVTESGLATLSVCSTLRRLDLLSNPRIDDRAIAGLRSWPNLIALKLAGDPLTPDCLAYIAELPNLKILELDCAVLGTAGLEPLKQLSGLGNLRLTNPGRNFINEIDLIRLQRVMPALHW